MPCRPAASAEEDPISGSVARDRHIVGASRVRAPKSYRSATHRPSSIRLAVKRRTGMDKRISLLCIAICSLAGLAACSADSAASNDAGRVDEGITKAILGTWQSKDCETASTDLTRRRVYVFTPEDVAITYDLFAGAGCNEKAKLFTVTTHGDSAFVGASSAVAGATNVVFTFKSRAAAPTAAGVNVLQKACPKYSWSAGVAVDLSKDGCGALVQSNTDCPVEYDLAAIVSGVAFFGDPS